MKKSRQAQTLIDLSIVIPAYREERRIGATLDELADFLKKDQLLRTKNVEVIVVSADSPDDTHKIVLDKKKNFKHLILLKPGPKLGKGRDVQFGMIRAKGKLIVFMDADLATPLTHLTEFYAAGEKGADVIIGTRNLRKHHRSIARRGVASAGNILFRLASGIWIEDSQCGFKMFSQRATEICFSKLTITGWGFDMEVLAIAHANNMQIKAYRIDDWQDMLGGTFEGSAVKNSLNSLDDLRKIVRNRLKRAYRSH